MEETRIDTVTLARKVGKVTDLLSKETKSPVEGYFILRVALMAIEETCPCLKGAPIEDEQTLRAILRGDFEEFPAEFLDRHK